MSTEAALHRPGMKDRFFNALKPKKSRTRLRKDAPLKHKAIQSQSDDNYVSPLELHRQKYKNQGALIDTQLGERRDDTELLHGLTHRGSFESFKEELLQSLETRDPGERIIASLPPSIWELILEHLTLTDAANLALTSKTLHRRIGRGPWNALNNPEYLQMKIDFLLPMDAYLPNHLFCFPCATYHQRIQRDQERLRPNQVLNHIFNCPNAYVKNPLNPVSTRITPRRALPFSFLQLALRAQKYGLNYGIALQSLSRRWTEDAWSHTSNYSTHKDHLLLRVTSTCFAEGGLPPSSLRNLLYSREDYTPYFSVCSHWRDGILMDLCKCALGHIPKPAETSGPRGMAAKVQGHLNGTHTGSPKIVTLCSRCRSIRRCTECLTEYLIEIKLTEVKSDRSFQQAIVVTRWSDLGNEKSPWTKEWGACNGLVDGFDSFAVVGKRAISGIFEAGFTEELIPGQRVRSLNPKAEKRDEEEDGWY